MRIVKRDSFYICGYAVDTTLAKNEADVAALYHEFFRGDKQAILQGLQEGCASGYYGLSWYTQGHERYCYLLGMEVSPGSIAPEGAMLKQISASTFAVSSFSKGDDIIVAWNDFFYRQIPDSGYLVNNQINLYFEFYPGSVEGEYELWTPVTETKR